MISEARKQSMAWMETDYPKHSHFRWKTKWLKHFWRARNYGWNGPLSSWEVRPGISALERLWFKLRRTECTNYYNVLQTCSHTQVRVWLLFVFGSTELRSTSESTVRIMPLLYPPGIRFGSWKVRRLNQALVNKWSFTDSPLVSP